MILSSTVRVNLSMLEYLSENNCLIHSSRSYQYLLFYDRNFYINTYKMDVKSMKILFFDIFHQIRTETF